MILPRIREDARLYERAMTRNKFSEVNRLPEEDKGSALQAVVENHLSTEETKALTQKVEQGSTVEQATSEIILRRETIKPERFAERRRRIECPTCKGKGYVLKSESL
ncbi:MAG: hypothetical protein OK455_10000 [Thaumarchaeota archaeon]|nr:hypothetical protein [Nitrososphaerota archaeon]